LKTPVSRAGAVFLDRDGTLMENVPYCRRAEDVHVFPGVDDALSALRRAGWRLIVITNQSGIARGLITPEAYEAVTAEFERQVGEKFDAIYFCADSPDAPSSRRKPAIGMLEEAAAEHGIDLRASWLIGDSEVDMRCGSAGGCRTILVRTGNGSTVSDDLADFVCVDFLAAAAILLETDRET